MGISYVMCARNSGGIDGQNCNSGAAMHMANIGKHQKDTPNIGLLRCSKGSLDQNFSSIIKTTGLHGITVQYMEHHTTKNRDLVVERM